MITNCTALFPFSSIPCNERNHCEATVAASFLQWYCPLKKQDAQTLHRVTPLNSVYISNFADLCESKQCKTWEKCVHDRTNGAMCVCREDLDCHADFQPVCGSDAKRYNNDCIMKARACREGKSVKKVAGGSCTPGMCNLRRQFYANSICACR